MKKTKSEKLVDFLHSHPLISQNALEMMCNIPQSTIHKALKGDRNIPDVHIPIIEKVLKKYGYVNK